MSPPPPQTQNESASLLTAFYCVTRIQAEIHHLFPGRACTNTILVNFGGGGGRGREATPVHEGAGNIDPYAYIPIFRKAYRYRRLF